MQCGPCEGKKRDMYTLVPRLACGAGQIHRVWTTDDACITCGYNVYSARVALWLSEIATVFILASISDICRTRASLNVLGFIKLIWVAWLGFSPLGYAAFKNFPLSALNSLSGLWRLVGKLFISSDSKNEQIARRLRSMDVFVTNAFTSNSPYTRAHQ